MTTLTPLLLAVMLFAAVTRHGYWRALAIGGATPVGAGLFLNGVALPTFYLAAVGALLGVAVRFLGRTRRTERLSYALFPGAVPLLLFAVWAIFVTLVAPLIFEGTETLRSDGTTQELQAGTLTTSNIAQILYLLLGLAVVFFLARTPGLGPQVIGWAATLVTVLSFWRYLSISFGLPFPEGLFDNSPLFVKIETEPGGAPRFRGILSEPAGLAGTCLVSIAYSLSRATQVAGLHRAGVLTVAAMAAFMASISTSATFVVASVALVVLVGLTFLAHIFIKRGGLPRLAILAATAAAVAALWVLPWAAETVEQVVDQKVSSSSFEDRSGADERSYGIVFETLGFGVGLGAHRPSSFVAALLSTTGIVGTVLFASAVWAIVRSAIPYREFRPVIWALTAVLITKVIAGPDLGDTSGVLWMSLGALAYAGMNAGRSPSLTVPELRRARH
ncbi:hypothetical protein ACFFGH_26560 [Lysobacter korlensis]|uniref:Uncharacterized protein n=1 Tax=Lysobacter korlensis TaxID=553636 RepID=A0ABV6RWP6_9GAMM